MSKKVVLITGVSSGFGHAIASYLASKNYAVYGTVRREVYPIDGVHFLTMDVTDRKSVFDAVEQLIQREGKIDFLINNAGMGIGGAVEQFSLQEIELQMRTNFIGYVNTIHAVLPHMRKRKRGKIINISSLGGIMGLPYQGFYSASKFAVEGLSEALSLELIPYNIQVVVVRPGDFHTHFTQNRKLVQVHTNANDPYHEQLKRTVAVIESDEQKGLPPRYLAHKIEKILRKKHPKFSYIVASPEQRLAVLLKRILPQRWFFKILASHYKIN
ncbi:MAG TPA: SDR family oxidoreductase [Bacteroidales bacterium]|nr:SDR family oxidoreductase [Bacteroidales bacterium]HPO65187.1 SDR family oxidoreductase [Bacteroidales bacterium]